MRVVDALMLQLIFYGLLVSVTCEIRALDPEVEDEEGGALPGLPHPKPEGDKGKPTGQNGNWCAFVQKRVVTMATAYGLEKMNIRTPTLCPSGSTECQLSLYKLLTRPIYRQTQRTFTSLQWRCCPGYVGDDCEDSLDTVLVQQQQHQQIVDVNQEQNDHQMSTDTLTRFGPGRMIKSWDSKPAPAPMFDHYHHHHHHSEQQQAPGDSTGGPGTHILEVVSSQMRSLLDGFNRSVESLIQQVGDLTFSVDELKKQRQDLQSHKEVQPLEKKVDEVSQQILMVHQHLENQRVHVEHKLHSQHAMLHYNLTTFKTDIDMKLKRHQKMLQQTTLQSINNTMSDLKGSSASEHTPAPPKEASELWEDVKRPENKKHNTMKVTSKDVSVTLDNMQQLKYDLIDLEKQLNQTARKTQVLFMETGLEVEDAKNVVLKRVEELAMILSRQDQQLQELNDLYNTLKDQTASFIPSSPTDCECPGLKAAVVLLQESLFNMTTFLNNNNAAVQESSRERTLAGSGANKHQDLQLDLDQLRNLVSTEQSRTTNLTQDLLKTESLLKRLQEDKVQLQANVRHLSASFTSLLKDAARYSEVLELLLGEEVLEFLEFPLDEQAGYSIPALKSQMYLLQKQQGQNGQNLPETPESGDEEDNARAGQLYTTSLSLFAGDQFPSETRNSPVGPSSRERRLLQQAETGAEGNHEGLLLILRQKAEEGEWRLSQLEARPHTQDRELFLEVERLKRGLEEHLRLFKTVFRNADLLMESKSSLDLDQLWSLLRRKAEKTKKHGGGNKPLE